MLSNLISIVKRGLVVGHAGNDEEDRVPVITLYDFTKHWQERIEGAQCAESLCSLLKSVSDSLASSTDEGGMSTPTNDATPSRLRRWGAKYEHSLLRISDWSYLELGHNAYSALPGKQPRSLRLPFPEGTGASQMLRDDLLLTFAPVFLACNLLELLVSHIASLPQEERDRASNLISASKPSSPRTTFFAAAHGEHTPLAYLSLIFQLTLVHPYSTTLASDALSKCVFCWQSSSNAQDGQLPPRVLLLELLQMGSRSWLVESCNFALRTLSVRWTSLAAEVDATSGPAKKERGLPASCEALPVPASGRAPSSSAESAETLSARDPYLLLSTSLDSQKNNVDLTQQLLNLAVLYCWLKGAREAALRAVEAHVCNLRDVNDAWNEKLHKSIDRLSAVQNQGGEFAVPEETQARFAKQEEEESILGQQISDLNGKKQKITADREQKERQIQELRVTLKRLEKESLQLREEEMVMASQICELSEAMESVAANRKREQSACQAAIERERSALEDLNSINSFIKAAQSGGEEVQSAASQDELVAIEQTFGEYASRFVYQILPGLLATQKQFIEFCCQRIAQRKPPAVMAADMVSRQESTAAGRYELETYRINLYRPVLAQSITNLDRIVHSANVGISALKDLPLGSSTLDAAAFMEGYQSCRQLVADNYAIIYVRDPTQGDA